MLDVTRIVRGDLVMNDIKLHISNARISLLHYLTAHSSNASMSIERYTPMLCMGYHYEARFRFYILRIEQDDVLLPEWLFPNVSVVSRFKDAQEVDA